MLDEKTDESFCSHCPYKNFIKKRKLKFRAPCVTYLYGLNVLMLIKTYFFTYISSIPKLFRYS